MAIKICQKSIAFLLMGFLLPQAALCAETTKKAQINTLKSQIQASSRSLKTKKAETASLQLMLQQTAQQLATVKKRRNKLESRVAKLSEQTQSKKEESKTIQAQLAIQQHKLGNHLRAIYRTGRSPALRTLLSIDSAPVNGRLLRYYKHISQQQALGIQEAKQHLTLALQTERNTQSEQTKLRREIDTLKALGKKLATRKKQRATLLANLKKKMSTVQNKLSGLKGSQEKLLAQIEAEKQRAENSKKQQTNGSLPWPLEGKLSAKYGQRKPKSTAAWAGIFIAAEKSKPVVAVHEGQVVYAEWLRGFGLLIIVDHGNGMMSLYGNNDKLMYQVGETVLPGDTIASVGNSSSLNQVGLYFELRQDGSPVDPLKLLSKKMTAAQR